MSYEQNGGQVVPVVIKTGTHKMKLMYQKEASKGDKQSANRLVAEGIRGTEKTDS